MARRAIQKAETTVTRYTYDEIKAARTPETGHTSLLPGDEQVVALRMDNGWTKGSKLADCLLPIDR